jgi:hypothetical protein
MAEGYHVTTLLCRKCRHRWTGYLQLNALVGKTHRLRCSVCDGRDVAVSMSWTWGKPPKADVTAPVASAAYPE